MRANRRKKGKEATPPLAGVCDQTEVVYGDVVHWKGADDCSAKVMVEHMIDLGHPIQDQVTVRWREAHQGIVEPSGSRT